MSAPVIIVKEGSCVIEVHRQGGGNTLIASLSVPDAHFNFKGSKAKVNAVDVPANNGEYRMEFTPGQGGNN